MQHKEIKVIKTLGDVGSWLHLWGRNSWLWEKGWCYPSGWARQLGLILLDGGALAPGCARVAHQLLCFSACSKIHHSRGTLQLRITDGPKCWWLTRFPLQVVGNCTSPVQRGNDKSVVAQCGEMMAKYSSANCLDLGKQGCSAYREPATSGCKRPVDPGSFLYHTLHGYILKWAFPWLNKITTSRRQQPETLRLPVMVI